MRLDVKIDNEQIIVKCEIEIESDSYTFALAETLNISHIRNNTANVLPHIEDYEMQFLAPMKKYECSHLEAGSLVIEYSGSLTGYFLFMQEEIYHFSIYNSWYPIWFDSKGDYEVVLEADDSYELINGVYEKNVWTYTTAGQMMTDCNILLIHREKSFHYRKKNISLYYFDGKLQDYMKEFFDKYAAVYDYYLQFYNADKIGHTSIVFLPERYQIGAYKREHLIVFSEVEADIDENMHRLAHEMGHAYAVGAPTDTWEDWLNETHAEWSALLYEAEKEPHLFEKSIHRKLSAADDKNYSLKPFGDSRPENVHEAGTLIYYQIYLQYGIESIKLLLCTFDELKNKNTADFIRALRLKDLRLAKELEIYIPEGISE